MTLSAIGCARCGSGELIEAEGYLQCVYCQSRYSVDAKDVVTSKPTTSMTSQEQIDKFGPSFGEVSAARVTETVPVSKVSEKSWAVALVLSLLFGWLGVDRFYLGQVGLGIAKFLTAGGFGIWWLIDVVLIGLKRARDSGGRRLI